MDQQHEALFQIPPLFFLFCWISAMGMVAATVKWLWQARDESRGVKTLTSEILLCEVAIILGCTLFSFFYTIYALFIPDEKLGILNFIPEPLIIGAFSFGYGLYLKKNSRPVLAGFLNITKHLSAYIALCAIGWILTIACGYLLYYAVVFLSRNESDFIIVALMGTGMLWNVPILGIHRYLRKKYPQATKLRGLYLHQLLAPVLAAYFLMMLPFIIQESANAAYVQEKTISIPIKKI